MLILLNHPLIALLFYILLLICVWHSKNKYGVTLNLKSLQKVLDKHKDNNLQIVDIRTKQRFDDLHVVGSSHVSSEENFKLKNKGQNANQKLLIVHDSNLELASFSQKHGLTQFNDHIYQIHINDLKLSRYINKYFISTPKKPLLAITYVKNKPTSTHQEDLVLARPSNQAKV